jgi:tetratricopeptide (TPR) repeat protein
MNKMRCVSWCALAVLSSALAWMGGCSDGKVTNPFETEKVVADVDIGGEMKAVEASGNEHSKQGVKQLRAENWQAAAEELRQAVAADPRDWRSSYALGVAEEKLGNKAAALKAYEQANLNVKGAGNADITAAILRNK